MRRLLTACLCCFVVGCNPPKDARAPTPGIDLYAVAPDAITEVLLSSNDQKVFAYRWRAGDPFHITVSTPKIPGGENCMGGEGFTGWLRALSSAKVSRTMEPPIDAKSANWAMVRLRDGTGLEPVDVKLYIPSSDAEPVVVEHEGKQFVVGMSGSVLRSARSGCQALAR